MDAESFDLKSIFEAQAAPLLPFFFIFICICPLLLILGTPPTLPQDTRVLHSPSLLFRLWHFILAPASLSLSLIVYLFFIRFLCRAYPSVPPIKYIGYIETPLHLIRLDSLAFWPKKKRKKNREKGKFIFLAPRGIFCCLSLFVLAIVAFLFFCFWLFLVCCQPVALPIVAVLCSIPLPCILSPFSSFLFSFLNAIKLLALLSFRCCLLF